MTLNYFNFITSYLWTCLLLTIILHIDLLLYLPLLLQLPFWRTVRIIRQYPRRHDNNVPVVLDELLPITNETNITNDRKWQKLKYGDSAITSNVNIW